MSKYFEAMAVVREGDQVVGVWSIETAPNQFLRELVELAVLDGEATAQDAEGCSVTAVRQDGDSSLTSAEKVVLFAHSIREDGFYCRPRDGEIRSFGGRMISSSNDGESIISFSPTDVWEFEDGSRVEVAYSDAEVL